MSKCKTNSKVHILLWQKLKSIIILYNLKCPYIITIKDIWSQLKITNIRQQIKSPYIIMAQTQKSANHCSNSKVHILLWQQFKRPYIIVEST